MTAPFISDALGPKARRRVLIATVVSGLAIVIVMVLAVRRLADRGQFDARLWRPLADPAVLRFLLRGLRSTVAAAVVAMSLSMVAGGFLALGRLSRTAPVRWLAGGYVEIFRAMPLIILMYFCVLALPKYGIDLSPFQAVVLALVAYNSAVLGEIFRAGILSLDRGQSEAAYAVGLTYWQAMLGVIVPQAARRMVPAIVSQLVTLLKDTSLGGAVIGFDDLLRRSRDTSTFYSNFLQVFAAAAAVYILVNFCLSRLARRLEIRQRRRYGASAIQVTGVEELAVVGVQAEAAMPVAGVVDSGPGKV